MCPALLKFQKDSNVRESLRSMLFLKKVKAFSLIELIIVFIIIGILLSVAASTAVWLSSRTETASAESSLNTVLNAQRESSFAYAAWETDFSALYLPSGPEVSAEVSLSPSLVSSKVSSKGDLYLAVSDANGNCIAWKVLDPLKGAGTIVLNVDPSSFCSAEVFAAQYDSVESSEIP